MTIGPDTDLDTLPAPGTDEGWAALAAEATRHGYADPQAYVAAYAAGDVNVGFAGYRPGDPHTGFGQVQAYDSAAATSGLPLDQYAAMHTPEALAAARGEPPAEPPGDHIADTTRPAPDHPGGPDDWDLPGDLGPVHDDFPDLIDTDGDGLVDAVRPRSDDSDGTVDTGAGPTTADGTFGTGHRPPDADGGFAQGAGVPDPRVTTTADDLGGGSDDSWSDDDGSSGDHGQIGHEESSDSDHGSDDGHDPEQDADHDSSGSADLEPVG